jgi:hypothetical protein
MNIPAPPLIHRIRRSHFVEVVQILQAPKQCIEALAQLRPGQYIICDKETGERVAIIAGGEKGF